MKDKTRILLIDDDDEMRKALTKFLGRKNFDVHIAENAAVALTKIKPNLYDVLLVDIFMPAMTGLELLSVLRHRHALVDFIVMTGSDSPEHRDQAFLLGAKGYFVKPFNPDELTSLIEKIINGKGE